MSETVEWTDCQHWLFTASTRFNGGEPVYTCDNCNTIVGRVSREMIAVGAENTALRAKVARVEAVLRDISDPNPEADQDWHDDPIGCVADDLRVALADRQTDD